MEFLVNEDESLKRDEVSGLPILHLSFVLRHFLPMSYCLYNRRPLEDHMKTLWGRDDGHATVLPSGSLFEGMNLPPTIQGFGKAAEKQIDSSDQDQMILVKGKCVIDGEQQRRVPKEGEDRLYIHTAGVHPGYLQLRGERPERTRNPEMYVRKEQDGHFYYSPNKVKEMVRAEVELVKERHQELLFTEQGPALTIQTPQIMLNQEVFFDNDFVFPAFACPVWPGCARAWVTRLRPSGWPDPGLINDIVNAGCHVVPVPHPHSQEPSLEWRMSFSLAEMSLMRGITTIQRQSYLLLKTVHSHALKEPKALISYHLKNVFLWTCEEVPREDWTPDNIASCFFGLLDRLEKCLQRGEIPSYFIPSNNLIDRYERGVLQELAARVCEIRKNPLTYLFEFNKKRKWFFGPVLTDAEEIFKPVVEHASNATDLKGAFDVCVSMSSRLVVFHLGEHARLMDKKRLDEKVEGEFDPRYTYPYMNAIETIEDYIRMCRLVVTHVDLDVPTVLVEVAGTFLLEYVDVGIGFYEVLLDTYRDAVNARVMRAHLARLYHVKSERLSEDVEKHGKLRQKADDNFRASVEGHPDARSDYAWFLLTCGEPGRCAHQARLGVEEVGREATETTVVYHRHDNERVDEKIRAEIERKGEFEVPTVAVCYYLLVKAQSASGQDATETLKDFQGYLRLLRGSSAKSDAVHGTKVLLSHASNILGWDAWFRLWLGCQIL